MTKRLSQQMFGLLAKGVPYHIHAEHQVLEAYMRKYVSGFKNEIIQTHRKIARSKNSYNNSMIYSKDACPHPIHLLPNLRMYTNTLLFTYPHEYSICFQPSSFNFENWYVQVNERILRHPRGGRLIQGLVSTKLLRILHDNGQRT